jgi:hypothetical protein
MRRTYQVLAIVIAALVAVQGATIAFAAYGMVSDLDGGKALTKDYGGNAGWALHAIGGMIVVPLLSLALLVISFFVNIPDARRWAGGLLGLLVVQAGLGFASHGLPAIGLLHGLNAFLVFAAAAMAARQASRAPAAVVQPEVRTPAPTA